MSAPGPGTLVLFVGGDPSLEAERAGRPPMLAGMARLFVPGPFLIKKPPPASPRDPDAPWEIPADQVMSAQRVLDAAKRAGRTVRIVDVNRPGADRGLVERFVGPGDVLPILLRSDGERLEGAESFEPATLRGFLAVP